MNSIFIFIWLIAQLAFSDMGGKDSVNIQAYEISQIMPDITLEGTIPGYDTSIVRVYYYRNTVLYHLSYLFSSENDSGIVVPLESRSHFLSFKRGASYGYDYDKHRSPEKLKVRVDSVLNNEWIVRNDLYGMFRYGRPILTSELLSNDSLKQTYRMFDTGAVKRPMVECKIAYTKLIPHIDLSICSTLDTLKNMKLCYFEFTADADYIRSKGIKQGIYKSEYHLRKITVNNKDAILRYFE